MLVKSENPIVEKSYAFALRAIGLHQFLATEKSEYTLSKQVLRSGTSIGANVEEAVGAQSDKDFAAKLNIAYKEARETHYWIRLLRDSKYITPPQAESLLSDCDELLKILGSILKTLKRKIQ